MNGKECTFDSREKALECMKGRLATLRELEFHILKTEPIENLTKVTEVQMLLETDGKTVIVKMSRETFDTFEIKVKQFRDRYTRFW